MSQSSFSVSGNYVDIFNQMVFPAQVDIVDGKVDSITPLTTPVNGYIIPGFIDSHIHIESSMLVPSEFAKIAVTHGTVATISDPHEIANVCGMEGVEFMIENGEKVNFKFYFGAPSCVPATIFETAGAALDSNQVGELLAKPTIKYLSEMMNFPGVLFEDEEVMKKIAIAKSFGKPIDGHAPGLRGEDVKKYIAAGISTDHECFTKEEALEKLSHGMKIIIREGSAAKNYNALIDLLHDHPSELMFCSDDKHPDSLVDGHINQLCKRAVADGIGLFNVLRAACVNPVEHYQLEVGLLRKNDSADFIVVKDLINFEVEQTYINGELVAENGVSFIPSVETVAINQFSCSPINEEDVKVTLQEFHSEAGLIPVIEALEGQLITNKLMLQPTIIDNAIVSDTAKDVLKIVVVNRYHQAPLAKGFIKNFNLKSGAIASSVAHDSHNIVAIGVDDTSLARAINLIIQEKGGVSVVVNESNEFVLPLPVAGLMSTEEGYSVAESYIKIDNIVKSTLGCTLAAPFMTLSFMALLVIPSIKLSDKGLFNGDSFSFFK